MMALDPVLVFTLLVLGSFLTATATICCYVARRQHRRRQRAAVQADTRYVIYALKLECTRYVMYALKLECTMCTNNYY